MWKIENQMKISMCTRLDSNTCQAGINMRIHKCNLRKCMSEGSNQRSKAQRRLHQNATFKVKKC